MNVVSLPIRVAGLRVTRALARGVRADLLIVRDEVEGVLVAKLFHPSADRAQVDRECAALARVTHRHVLRLLDVECTSHGTVAIVSHLGAGSLARWLEARQRVSAGEAVTVLAPLASAIEALHAGGVAHGRLASPRVLFDSEGAPVISGFAAAALFAAHAPPAVRERIPEVHADLEALRGIADTVLGRVAGSGARRAAELRAEVAGSLTADLTRILLNGLFAFAAGSPVRFADDAAIDPEPGSIPAPSRMPSAAARLETPQPAAPRGPARPARAHPGPRSAAAALLERGPLAVIGGRARRRWSGIDRGRRRMVVGLLAAGATAAMAVALVPGGSGTSSRAAARPGPAVSAAAGSTGVSGAPASRERPVVATSSGARDAESVQDADPLRALPVLLRTRTRCLRDQDRACLRATDEPDSPADAADGAAMDSGSALVLSAEGARVVQTLGAVAIVETGTPPVRVVMVRLAGGEWRIRDLPTAAVG